jgi:antitoxin component YwqK of YwqJK toxin-antitoxin module
MEISYREGRKNGPRITYREEETVEETFVDDLKQGTTVYYYPDGSIKKTVLFENGLEDGLARVYDTSGVIMELITYKKGFITDRERINRYDNQGFKHGKWKSFYEDGSLMTEGNYKHGLKHGYFKEYDIEGNLLSAAKYLDDIKQVNVAELKKLDVQTEYYPSGKVRIRATYKDDRPEGVWREYDEEGKIEKSYIYKNGIVIGEGIVTENGEKDGFWKEFYENGQLRAEGNYNKDRKTGEWKFYHRNGKIEQTGAYESDGSLEGPWTWYYESGITWREENYYEGKLDGMYVEYDELGNIITKGEFIEGREDGFWFYELGDHREEGNYTDGLRSGDWIYYYNDGSIQFEGRFIEGNPHGRHVYYWPDGKKKDEGNYIMGIRHGEWTSYNLDGTPFLVITYQNGIEKKYDGIKIVPEYTAEDFE